MADIINNSQFGIYRVGRVRITRDNTINGDWIFRVPQHVITSLNKSTALGYGTSFDSDHEITAWLVGSGTYAGVAGTSVGLFFGTGRSG